MGPHTATGTASHRPQAGGRLGATPCRGLREPVGRGGDPAERLPGSGPARFRIAMAKKRGGSSRGGRRRLGADEDDSLDDSASAASTSTFTACSDWDGAEGTAGQEDPFEGCTEALYEKRSSTRERALDELVALLATALWFDEVDKWQDTLAALLVSCLRRGSGAEAGRAARALGLLLVTLGPGPDAERHLSLFRPALEAAAGAVGRAETARAAAVESLALATFVAAEDASVTLGVMGRLASWWQAGSAAVAAAALRGWSLLLTTAPRGALGGAAVEAWLGGLAGMLHAGDISVRTAAGEGVTLLLRAAGLADLGGDSSDSGDDEDAGLPEVRDGGPETADTGPGPQQAPGVAEVLARMRALALNHGDAARRSRRDRAALRAVFRSLCAAAEDGTVVPARVRLRHGDVLVVGTAEGLAQLAALRRFLAEGFQAHLQANPLLHQVFDFEPRAAPAERLTPLEKRLLRSPASAAAKHATQGRASARASVAAYKRGMLAGD